jgi:hypothetical protein
VARSERLIRNERKYDETHRVQRRAAKSLYYQINKVKTAEYDKARYNKLRDAAFEAYGGYVCKCCGETRRSFMVLDHVNDDGHIHRRKVGSSTSCYRWLRDNNYPPGFLQPLCANCNTSKAINHGVCEHQLPMRR